MESSDSMSSAVNSMPAPAGAARQRQRHGQRKRGGRSKRHPRHAAGLPVLLSLFFALPWTLLWTSLLCSVFPPRRSSILYWRRALVCWTMTAGFFVPCASCRLYLRSTPHARGRVLTRVDYNRRRVTFLLEHEDFLDERGWNRRFGLLRTRFMRVEIIQ